MYDVTEFNNNNDNVALWIRPAAGAEEILPYLTLSVTLHIAC
jgi:hypothetical protein